MPQIPFNWTHVSTPPPSPGEYLTLRVIRVETDRNGLTTFTIERPICNIWDGEKWEYPAGGWRAMERGLR